MVSSACSTLPGANVAADGLGQGIQQEHRLADPVGQRRAIEFDAFAGIDAGLAVQRCMVAELRHQNLREQARTGPAAFDRQATASAAARSSRKRDSSASGGYGGSP